MALGGAVAGVLQWLVLREKVSLAGWWVLASCTGWGLAMATGLTTMVLFERGGILGLALSPSLAGPVLGGVTGVLLFLLLRSSDQ